MFINITIIWKFTLDTLDDVNHEIYSNEDVENLKLWGSRLRIVEVENMRLPFTKTFETRESL